MYILTAARQRYAVKAYDPALRVPEHTMQQIYELLRHAPSSMNFQPWHFVVASTPAGRERMLKGVQGGFGFNAAKVRDASHVVLLCARTDVDAAHLDRLLEQEQRDGRFGDAAARTFLARAREGCIGQHREVQADLPQWLEKQVYIALGSALLGAAALGVDSTPMEGIDRAVLDAEFGLREQGLGSLVMLCFGYRARDDANAGLPKSRLAQAQVFTFV
jgi:nitroreductase/dihydropteridine reductase